MKNAHYFKTAIDILFLTFITLITATIFFVIMGIGEINTGNEINTNTWLGLIQIIPITLFIFGIWFLRKVAILYIKKKGISFETQTSIKKAGKYFLLAGGIKIILSIIPWTKNIAKGEINFSMNDETILTFILIIIGLFMLLQSKTMEKAKEYKDEINLTI